MGNHTAYNTVTSPKFLVWKFCGKAQFSHSFGRFARNYAETAFPQNFITRKLWYFTQCKSPFMNNQISKIVMERSEIL